MVMETTGITRGTVLSEDLDLKVMEYCRKKKIMKCLKVRTISGELVKSYTPNISECIREILENFFKNGVFDP